MFWAVAVEFQCYLLFPLLIKWSNTYGSRVLVAIILAAMTLRLALISVGLANPRDLSYSTIAGRLDQFCIGMILARTYSTRARSPLHALLFIPAISGAIGVIHVFNSFGGWPVMSAWKIVWPTLEGATWALVIITYLSAASYLPRPLTWVATKFGEISYSFYMVHFAVIAAIIKYGTYVRFTGSGNLDSILTTALVAFPIATIMALTTYHLIERPFLRRRPRYIRTRAASAGVEADGLQLTAGTSGNRTSTVPPVRSA